MVPGDAEKTDPSSTLLFSPTITPQNDIHWENYPCGNSGLMRHSFTLNQGTQLTCFFSLSVFKGITAGHSLSSTPKKSSIALDSFSLFYTDTQGTRITKTSKKIQARTQARHFQRYPTHRTTSPGQLPRRHFQLGHLTGTGTQRQRDTFVQCR